MALKKVDEQLQSRGVTWLNADTPDQRHRSIQATGILG